LVRYVAIPAGRFDWSRYLKTLDPEEIDGLLELWSVEPWDDYRSDLRTRDMLRWILAGQGMKPEDIPDDVMNYLGKEMRTTVQESMENVRLILRGNG
jgi:hypothetical protein